MEFDKLLQMEMQHTHTGRRFLSICMCVCVCCTTVAELQSRKTTTCYKRDQMGLFFQAVLN